jgi:predicted metal-binding protein
MKCTFGCDTYSKNASCPPNVPSVEECREFFSEYSDAVIIHFKKSFKNPDERHKWTKKVNLGLLKLERDVFMSGNQKVFLLFMDTCDLCKSCTGVKSECSNRRSSRPTPEAFAVDVFSTVRKYGYPIEVLHDYTQEMNRYAFLLIQ